MRAAGEHSTRGELALAAGVSVSPRSGIDVLVETKLHAPHAHAEWVERPELVQVLEDTQARLILVGAPAGYGKTTLLAQWRSAAAASRQFAWVSLDSGDDDPVRLWRHLVTALHRACPDLGVEEILRPLHRPVPDVSEALSRLVNELTAFAVPVVIIVDDYHIIKERRCHDQLEFLLRHLPSTVQVVLSTRADPLLPLGRLRAAGDMTEIRMRDLHFTSEEAGVLIPRVASVSLSERDLSDLVQRAEGWPAGIYLAALSLRDHPAPTDFTRNFTGSNRYIMDFLVEDVLSRQPLPVQQFLMRTAILGRFTAPLCDAVAETTNARNIIETLEDENLFLVALDTSREWFRYHHLFAQVLLGQLARAEPGTMPALHLRASAWHLEHGSVDEAIDHALAAGDAARSVRLMAGHWYRYVDAGLMATVRRWLRSLGDDQVNVSPLAAHCSAWIAALAGEGGAVRRWLPVIAAAGDDGPLPDGMRSLRASAALLEGTFGFEGIGLMRKAAAQAVELETNPASPWYTVARSSYGTALYLSGDLEAAGRQLEQALFNDPSLALARLASFAWMSLVAVEQGRLGRAEQLAHAARDLVADEATGLSSSPQATLASMAVGAVLAGQGQFQEARNELERALRSRRRWPGISPWPNVDILLRLALVLLELGDRPAAAALLGEVRDILTSLPDGAEAQLGRLARLERRLTRLPRARGPAEPLTGREQAVLQLLRGTLSLREIGQELYVSQNTVKSHARAIYQKLGVSTRQEAIERGRELEIL
ncbi:MAG: LuxR C-terminal-related transcriptional regulator [Actinomycetota bacterium]